MPLLLLVLFLTQLLIIAVFIFDIYLIREWYQWKDTFDDEYARRCIYGAICLTAYSLVGKFPISWMLSRFRKNEDEPKQEHSKVSQKLKRPDGSAINIEFMGDNKLPPLLFVHGRNENSTAWYYQKKQFSKNNYVILIDLPGLESLKGLITKTSLCKK